MHEQCWKRCVLTPGLLFSSFDPERFGFNAHFIKKCYRHNDHMRGMQQLSPKLAQNMQIRPIALLFPRFCRGKWLACNSIDIPLIVMKWSWVPFYQIIMLLSACMLCAFLHTMAINIMLVLKTLCGQNSSAKFLKIWRAVFPHSSLSWFFHNCSIDCTTSNWLVNSPNAEYIIFFNPWQIEWSGLSLWSLGFAQ